MSKKNKFEEEYFGGVQFPQEYVQKTFTETTPILSSLSPLAEEMLWDYAQKSHLATAKEKVVIKNFWSDFKKELDPKYAGYKFPEDFTKEIQIMRDTNAILKEQKKISNKENAKEIAANKEAIKEQFGWAYIDGKRQPIAQNAMIEPPGIIFTRGASPIKGHWKYRTVPEDVTINWCSDKPVPQPPAGHKWKAVTHKKDSFVLANYYVNIGNVFTFYKKIMLSGVSDQNKERDEHKFEKAVRLVQNWDLVELHISKGLGSDDPIRRESALIAWLIQYTGIRIGHDKCELEADTVGASTLKVSNVDLSEKNKLKLDFLGKDSVNYKREFDIPAEIYDALLICAKGKSKIDKLFANASGGSVTAFLKEYDKELTPKLFRTALGTKVLCEELRAQDIKSEWSEAKKLAAFNDANLAVAKKLNHQRDVSANHKEQMNKANEGIKNAKEKLAEKKKKTAEAISKIDEKIKKVRKWSDKTKSKEELLKLKERKAKLTAALEKADGRLELMVTKRDIKQKTANYALGTSKNAYSSPKITISFCKSMGINPERIYSKGQLDKFSWAKDIEEDYWVNYPNVKTDAEV